MFESFLSTLGSKLFMTLLLTSTLVTTGVAVAKVSGNFTSANIPKNGINIEAVENIETKVEPTGIVATVTKIPSIVKSLLPSLVPTNTPVVVATTNSNACIITLSGQKYDVTRLRTTHSGGNVFVCGTDMTTSYTNRHGLSLSRMQQYLVDNNSGTSTSFTTPIGTQNNDDREDDREDLEHEDRYIKSENHEDNNDD